MPQLPDYQDPAKAEIAQMGYTEGLSRGYNGQKFKEFLIDAGTNAAIFIAYGLSLRAGIQREIRIPLPKGAVIHAGAELDARAGEVILNPGRQAMTIQNLRDLHPEKMVIQGSIEKMPFESGVAS